MKRFTTLILLLVFLAVPAAAQDSSAQPEEAADPVPVEVLVTVKDEDGTPLSGIMVQAQQVGRARQALTDKDGTCTLNLVSGDWIIKAIRLGAGNQLLRLEVSLESEEIVELPIVISSGSQATPVEDPVAGSEAFSAKNLDPDGIEALTHLDEFTDLVLQESLKKIVGQLASNKFTTTYWVQDKPEISDQIGGITEPITSFRLDNDWSGNVLTPDGVTSRRDAVEKMFASTSALTDVPVNVKFNISPRYAANRIPDVYNRGLGNYSRNAETPSSGGMGNLFRIPGNIAGMLTGGEIPPEEEMGYDLGGSTRQFASSSRGFYSYYNEINSSIVNLYRPLRDRYTNEVVSSASAVRAIEFGVEKTFLGGLRATVFYSYSEASGLDIRTVDLHFEEWQDFENFIEHGIRHDLSTNLEARIAATGTSVSVGYRFFINDIEDVALNETVNSLVSDYSRLNLRLQQSVGIGILSNAEISFNFAINNLLNSTRNTYISPTDLDEEITSSRKLLGGIQIEF